MTLTHAQKFAAVFLACTLVLSYVTANVRHAHQQAVIADKLEREESLHQSTDKLLQNCGRNEQKEATSYGAGRVICDQGAQAHERTERAMADLEARKDHARTQWYQTFVMAVVVMNALIALAFAWRRWAQKEQAE